jgi:hypothetical protein
MHGTNQRSLETLKGLTGHGHRAAGLLWHCPIHITSGMEAPTGPTRWAYVAVHSVGVLHARNLNVQIGKPPLGLQRSRA